MLQCFLRIEGGNGLPQKLNTTRSLFFRCGMMLETTFNFGFCIILRQKSALKVFLFVKFWGVCHQTRTAKQNNQTNTILIYTHIYGKLTIRILQFYLKISPG